MRLRTYSAKSTTEAMEKVRAELGDDAIIVANRRGPGGRGVQLTAAIDEKEEDLNVIASLTENDYPAPAEIADAARAALEFHGVPRNLVNRLITALNELETDDTTVALAGALDIGFKFEPLPVKRGHKPLILIGPPGSGKTLCTAKLATRAKLSNQPLEVYSADSLRAGGRDQLEAFTNILGLNLITADSPSQLSQKLAGGENTALKIIDTPGINPYDDTEMEMLYDLVKSANVEPVVVLAAGGDALETAEIANGFAGLGAKRLLVTRLDVTRRLGGILAAADAAHLIFSEASATAQVAHGLSAFSPVALARLIVPQDPVTPYQRVDETLVETPTWTKAAS